MKKILCILASIFILNFDVLAVNNDSFGYALPVDLNDSVEVYSSELGYGESSYYKIKIPYDGVLKATLTIKCTSQMPFSHSTKFNVYLYDASTTNIFYKECSGKYSENMVGKEWSHNVIDLDVSYGTYYIRIEDKRFYGIFRLTLDVDFTCSHSKTEDKVTISPTCGEHGESKIYCKNCQELLSTEKIDKLPHTPAEEWVTTKEVSCANDGEKKLYCTVCNEDVDTEIIEALPHTYGEWTQDKETSCSEPGERSRICADCNYKDTEEIEQLEHSYGEWKTEVEATCSEKGKHSRICTVCQHKAVEAIDKLDHKFGKWTTTETASCTQEGERERVCENCQHTETEKIDKTSHKFSKWTTTLEATESRQGKRTRTCSVCKETENDTIDRLECGSEYEWETYSEATCTSNGTRRKICSYCGKVLSTKTVAAPGHDYSDWKMTKLPTKNSDGTEVRYCDICNKSESRSVKLTHGDYGSWQITKEATCKETGVKSFICDCCGKATKTQNIPKNEHSYSTWKDVRHASPDRKGYRSRACSLCNQTETDEPEYVFEALKNQPEVSPPFTDVSSNDWFKPVVGKCYHYKLMLGNSESTFNPAGNITVAEVITSAVRIFCLLNPDENKPEITAEPWYQGYIDYAIDKKIIKLDDFADYTAPATRAQMAYIFANAASNENLKAINSYEKLPDVSHEHKYAKEIFSLYNAGVITGNDAQGTFCPENNIIRAEAAAIIARISGISNRIKK